MTMRAKRKPVTKTDADKAQHLKESKFFSELQNAADIILPRLGDNIVGNHMWLSFATKLANRLGIILPADTQFPAPDATRLAAMRDYMERLEVRLTVESVLFEGAMQDVLLDADWKSKATTYVSHIRGVVAKAEMQEGLRERILARLNALQREIDRNRTRVESLAEVFLSLTEAAGKGAKNLTPAIRLFERLAGAFSGARTARLQNERRNRLPAPESLGMIEGPPELTEEREQAGI